MQAGTTGEKGIRVTMRCRTNPMGKIFRFARNEDGAATIEAVLWLPFYLILFGLLADVSMVFHGQSKLLRIVQDANRNMSIGRLDSAEVIDFVRTRAGTFSTPTQITNNEDAGLITTSVTVPMRDLDLFGVAGVFGKAEMTVSSAHLNEMVEE